MVLLASAFDQSKYLRADDAPQEKLLRIKAVTAETLNDRTGQKQKLVLWFTNIEKGLVLNKDQYPHHPTRLRRRHRRLGEQADRCVRSRDQRRAGPAHDGAARADSSAQAGVRQRTSRQAGAGTEPAR
jgi:hypothetical protein